MAFTVPALRGRMGSIDFFQAKMRARDLVQAAGTAQDLLNLAELDIEERIQRELDIRRVRSDIAPYLTNYQDRFFGSMLILAETPEIFEFEPLSELTGQLPIAYRAAAADLGVLTIDGGRFVVLDGQHRWKALQMVVNGQDDQGNPITGPYSQQVPEDELVVVFVNLDAQTTRRVFNKINRNAKTTSLANNIITSEDDGYALITRRLLREGQPWHAAGAGEGLVNLDKTSLVSADKELTTLATLYQTVRDVLVDPKWRQLSERHHHGPLPEAVIQEGTEEVAELWDKVLEGVEVLSAQLDDPTGIRDRRNDPDDPGGLLLRPAGQQVLVKAIVLVRERDGDVDQAIERVNEIDWRMRNGLWEDVLVSPNGRVLARAENYRLAAEVVAYLVGSERLSEAEINNLEDTVADKRGLVSERFAEDGDVEEIYRLPAPIT